VLVSTVTWHFASVLNWIWCCCISTHLTFQVSQGSAATDLRWGENFNKLLFCNSLLNIVVKKLRKSVNICQSYWKNKSVIFYVPQCILPSSSTMVHDCLSGETPLSWNTVVGIHLPCNLVNVLTKLCKRLVNVNTNMTENNKMHMVFSHDNCFVASRPNAQQLPVTSAC